MSFERLLGSLLCVLFGFYLGNTRESATTLAAYYGAVPGEPAFKQLFAADVQTQTVRTLSDIGYSVFEGCSVLDAHNWTCPTADLPNRGGPSSINAVDGSITVTNTRILRPPEPWLLRQPGRLLDRVVHFWGAT
jgi:hypothetical protein